MNRDGLANFFLGLGLGVGLGLLFAPKSGEETREMLMDKANEGTDYLKRQKDTLADAIEAGKQAYREKVAPMGNSAPQPM